MILTFPDWLQAYKQITLQEFWDTSEKQQKLLENEYKEYTNDK